MNFNASVLLFGDVELSKENEKLKVSSQETTDGLPQTASEGNSAAGGNVGLMEELQVVRSERDRAVREEKSLRQSVTLLKQQKEVWT